MDPVHVSPRMFRNFWQEYRVYADRLELEFRLGFKTIVIPFEEILSVEIRPPLVVGDLFRGKDLKFALALKLDSADMYQHIAVTRKNGMFKNIRFTPGDPESFLSILQERMAQHSGR